MLSGAVRAARPRHCPVASPRCGPPLASAHLLYAYASLLCLPRTPRARSRTAQVVVGGRDKMVAMYDVEHGDSRTDARDGQLKWEVVTDDFVYAVAMSDDMEYVAYGGTAKTCVVLSAMSGTKIFQIDCSGVLWAVALFSTPKGAKLAYGGEISVITIYDLTTQKDELQLPATNTTNDIALTRASLCFADGDAAKLFGAGGNSFSWQEQPAIEVMSDMILTMASNQETVLHSVQLVLERHPAIVNARFLDTGASLIQFVITQTNQPKLLHALLRADCQMGLPVDHSGRSALHVAIEQGKWHSLQLLLEALRSHHFTMIPGSMAPILDCLREMAARYPLDFLSFIASFELQAEPEVLGESDVSDFMLSSRIVRGSSSRSPRGLWNEEITVFRTQRDAAGHELTRGVFELTQSVAAATTHPMAQVAQAAGLASRAPAAAGAQGGAQGGAPPIELGYNTLRHAGVQAYRVPFENFAALPSNGGISVLQLVVQAVNATKVDYSIFGSSLIELVRALPGGTPFRPFLEAYWRERPIGERGPLEREAHWRERPIGLRRAPPCATMRRHVRVCSLGVGSEQPDWRVRIGLTAGHAGALWCARSGVGLQVDLVRASQVRLRRVVPRAARGPHPGLEPHVGAPRHRLAG